MKTILVFFVVLALFPFLFSTIINVPADQPTIQSGINATVNGDTVLVHPGIYYENISFNDLSITLASLFLTTQDTTYISHTIIDGNQNGSVLLLFLGESTTVVIAGLTIQNGHNSDWYWGGGGISCIDYEQLMIMNCHIINNSSSSYGAGIYLTQSNTTIANCLIKDNISDDCELGGGICCDRTQEMIIQNTLITGNSAVEGGGLQIRYSNSSIENSTISGNTAAIGGGVHCDNSSSSFENVDIKNNIVTGSGGGIYSLESEQTFTDVTISNNTAIVSGGGIYCSNSDLIFSPDNRCNIYQNSNLGSRITGADLFASDCDIINVIVDTFTVFTPTEYHASPIENFTFDILNGQGEVIDSDLYVSPDGDNSNSGTNPEEPFRTISYAISHIYIDSLSPNTIHLAAGIYSPSTNGEVYPIDWLDHIFLEGAGQDVTILDAEN